MARSLALPTFKSGPQDDLAAPDIYKISSTETINKIVSLPMLEEVKVDKMSLLQGGKSMLEKAKGGLELAKALGNLNVKGGNTFSQMMSGASSLSNAVNAIPKDAGSIGKNFGTYMTGMGEALKTGASVMATIGGVQQQIAGIKNMAAGLSQGNVLSKITAAGNLLNAATGTSFVGGIVSNVQQVAGIASAVQVAAQSGIKGAFNAVVQGGLGTSALNQIASLSLPSVIKTADIPSLSSMANNLAPGVLKGINPNILGDVTKAFSLPANTVPTFMSETFTQVKDTFGKITPDWLSKPFGASGETVTDLSCVMGASKDFSLMSTTAILGNPNRSPEDELILAAVTEKPKDVHEELKAQFPAAQIQTVEVSPISAKLQTWRENQTMKSDLKNNAIGNVFDFTANNSSPTGSSSAVTNVKKLTPQEEQTLKNLNKQFKYDVVQIATYSKGWGMDQWLKGNITDDERDLVERAILLR